MRSSMTIKRPVKVRIQGVKVITAVTVLLVVSAFAAAAQQGDTRHSSMRAVSAQASKSLSEKAVYASPGSGSPLFLPALAYNSGGPGTWSIVAADLNGDGKFDLVVTNADTKSVGILIGNGDGTFRPVATYITLGFAIGLAVE